MLCAAKPARQRGWEVEERTMLKALLCSFALVSCAGTAQAQVMLSTYANKDGYVDVQKLTCGQLANTFQEDADYLTVWYSGWYRTCKEAHVKGRTREGLGA